MSAELNLLPQPQEVTFSGGMLNLERVGQIALNTARPADLLFTAQQLQSALEAASLAKWSLAGGASGQVKLTLDPAIKRAEGYRLTISGEGIVIAGHDLAGAFYGVQTLRQLLQTRGATLPQMVIEDWPDFPARGVMHDISRGKVPTMDTLYELIDMLAGWKVNQFQLYMEHTFAYQQHRQVWQNASPMTAEEILALDDYCRQRHIDLVPNQNSFGHMEHWFQHPQYRHLAETDREFMAPWGVLHPPSTLSPAVPESLSFLEGLYAELLPNFTGRMFNIGSDETFDLGLGRSKTLVEQKGKGRVYLDFLLEVRELAQAHDRTVQFWGDIINEYPELIPELPKDSVALEWGYEAGYDYLGKTEPYADAGIPFYVCPSTSSQRSILGRTDNCLANLREAAEQGLKNGAIGFLNTNWGDTLGWRRWFPVSYLGFAFGAAVSWAYAANTDLDVPLALDTFVFLDSAGVMGQLAYDLGNAYQEPGVLLHYNSFLYLLQIYSLANLRERADILFRAGESQENLFDDDQLRANLGSSVEYIAELISRIGQSRMERPDADLVKREFRHMARMAQHGARRGLLQLSDPSLTRQSMRDEFAAIEAEYPVLWLARSRPGGMVDSLRLLAELRLLYEDGAR